MSEHKQNEIITSEFSKVQFTLYNLRYLSRTFRLSRYFFIKIYKKYHTQIKYFKFMMPLKSKQKHTSQATEISSQNNHFIIYENER